MSQICNKLDSMRVIGYHVLAPNCGELMQGVGVARHTHTLRGPMLRIRVSGLFEELLDILRIVPDARVHFGKCMTNIRVDASVIHYLW